MKNFNSQYPISNTCIRNRNSKMKTQPNNALASTLILHNGCIWTGDPDLVKAAYLSIMSEFID